MAISMKKNLPLPIYAAIITIVFYFVVIPLLSYILPAGIIEKITNRGGTVYASFYLFFWSLLFLNNKRQLLKEREGLLANYQEIGLQEGFDEKALPTVIANLKAKSLKFTDSILGPRLLKGLENFLCSRNTEELRDILADENEAALAASHASFNLIRVFLWTIPILGFIGTVDGVSAAVGGFAEFLTKGVTEVAEIKTALSKITTGLAVAFDTTYIALLLTVVLMILTSIMEHRESVQLQQFDDFCQQRVLQPLVQWQKGGTVSAGQFTSQVDLLKNLTERISSLINLQHRLESRFLDIAGSNGFAATLANVDKALKMLLPYLQKVSDKPLDVQIKVLPSVSSGQKSD